MNVSVYLFGEFNSGYSQYPDDYTSRIFQKFYANSKSITQIAIHRDGNLVYYGYIRKLQQDRYLGLCVVLNGLMLKRIDGLFSLFENTISNLVINGKLIHFNDTGDLVTSVEKLYLNREEIDILTESLRAGFNRFESYSVSLPPVSYGTSKDSCRDFVIDDSQTEIVKSSYTHGYTYIYKSKGYNTAQLNSYKNVIIRSYREKQDILAKLAKSEKVQASLNKKLLEAKAQQRNMKWVSILGLVVLILIFVLWNKVLFPSEVTHYETGEFVYYGPIRDNKPHGVGVAIYPSNDKDGRKYYIGNFDNGERSDENAILFYQDGDYYYGSMIGDKWNEGVFYMNSDDSYFRGSFKDNQPYNGVWYDHTKLYDLVNGK